MLNVAGTLATGVDGHSGGDPERSDLLSGCHGHGFAWSCFCCREATATQSRDRGTQSQHLRQVAANRFSDCFSDHVVLRVGHEDADLARSDEDSVARLDTQFCVALQVQIDVQREAELFREDPDFGDLSRRVDLHDAGFETR